MQAHDAEAPVRLDQPPPRPEHTLADIDFSDPGIVADILGVFELILQFEAEDRASAILATAAD